MMVNWRKAKEGVQVSRGSCSQVGGAMEQVIGWSIGAAGAVFALALPEKRADPEGKALDLLVSLHSFCHPWT